MIIKKNSWHYRMNVWKRHEWRTQKQRTLCGYFWFTIMTMLRIIALPLAVYACFFVLGGALAHDIKIPAIHELPVYMNLLLYPLTGIMFIGSILGICACLAGTFWLAAKIITVIHEKSKERPKKEKAVREPGLLASYLKARKEKVCPIIKFEE